MEKISESLKFLFEELPDKFDEESLEFSALLSKYKIESKTVALSNGYEISKRYFPVREETFNKYYTFIDKAFYERISKILEEFDNLEKMDEVCLILKYSYYRVIKSELNNLTNTNADLLNRIFTGCLIMLQKETEIVKFLTLKDGSYSIKEPVVIKYFQKVLTENIRGYWDYIGYNEGESNISNDALNRKSNYQKVLEDVIYESTHDLLNCLTITGSKERFLQSINRDYSNRQLLVAFKLLEAVNLVDKDFRKNHTLAKAMRQKMNRRHEKDAQEMKESPNYKEFLDLINKMRES
jgi:hypothetical protein